MADNVDITPGTGATVAADDIGGVLHQRVKLSLGADGTANDASAGAGSVGTGTQRVTLASDDPAVASLGSLDNAVDGNYLNTNMNIAGTDVDSNSGNKSAATQRVVLATDQPALTNKLLVTPDLPSGASTEAKQDDIITAIGAIPGGGGTQYTEDAAAAANPVGTALNLVRDDSRGGSLTTTDGDNVAARGNNKGELYVKTTDSDALLTTIDADTGNISTKIDTVAGAVAGSEMQVDIVTSALPSGAATSAKQDTQITAEQAIQTSVELIDDAIKADDAAFTPGTTKVLMAGYEVDDTGTDSVDEGDAGAARMSANRNVYTQIRDAAGNERGANVNASNQLLTAESNSSSILTAVQKIDDPVIVDDAGFTPATSSVMMAGFEADESSTDSVDEGDGGAARMTLDRKQIVTVQPHTAGGWSIANHTSGDTFTALTNSAQAIKASAGQLGGWYIYNPNASAVYVNIYNIAHGSVTVGTSTPAMNLVIPATSAANLELVNGIAFSTAISASATTTGGGNSAPGTALEANWLYK